MFGFYLFLFYVCTVSWKKISLQQFADIYRLQTSEGDVAAKSLTLFEYLTGVDPIKVSWKKLAAWSKKNDWTKTYPNRVAKRLWIKGLYKVNLDPSTIDGDKFTIVASYSGKEGIIYNLAEIMAAISEPVRLFSIRKYDKAGNVKAEYFPIYLGQRDWAKRVELFNKHLSAYHAHGTALFFWNLWTNFAKSGPAYSASQPTEPNPKP